jgi:hypothetical protein
MTLTLAKGAPPRLARFSARRLRTSTILSWGSTLSIRRRTRFAMPRRTFRRSGLVSFKEAVCKHPPRSGLASAHLRVASLHRNDSSAGFIDQFAAFQLPKMYVRSVSRSSASISPFRSISARESSSPSATGFADDGRGLGGLQD